MACGVMVVHFGEPPEPDADLVERYLGNIFSQNLALEPEAQSAERVAKLARKRQPSLTSEYREIGGSPMNQQARTQASTLQETLASRGLNVPVRVAFQFLSPTIEEVVDDMLSERVDRLAVLPIYPLCGPSTTIATVETVDELLAAEDLDHCSITGWHRHPAYLELRARNLRSFVDRASLDLHECSTELLCSAHGTPVHYLEEGSRYIEYVEEWCAALAEHVGAGSYSLGYQNHENREIAWTEPSIEDVLADLEADRVIVEPVSFMHEQSETLAELDIDLAEQAAEQGVDFHRVPIPHDDPDFPTVLADLLEPMLRGVDPASGRLRQCACTVSEDAYCLNAPSG